MSTKKYLKKHSSPTIGKMQIQTTLKSPLTPAEKSKYIKIKATLNKFRRRIGKRK